jgi:hypothetical protein
MGMMRLATVVVLVSLSAGCGVAAAEEIDTSAGMAAASQWLSGVDRGAYGESWDGAAQRFRQSIDRDKWETTVEAVRRPLGAVLVRKLRIATFARALPDAPEGEYVVIQFDTRFERNALAAETVTSEREKDGTWRVAGYWIK